MDSEETLKYLQQKYPEDLNENYRCYWWCTSNDEHSYYYLPDVIMPPSQDSYNIEDILSEDQINSIKLFEDKKYFTQEEAHEVIEFLIKRCYELGATKNY